VRICIVLSSGGSVVAKVMNIASIQKSIYCIVTDREGNAQGIASEQGLTLHEIRSADNLVFSDALLKYCTTEKIDFIISFHTRLYAGDILQAYKNRIVNFHLSLLPAFPGFNPFEKALAHGVRLLGTTVHFIDETIDMGIPILQTVFANDPALTIPERRHLLFIQQCKSLIQVIDWIKEHRLYVCGDVCIVRNALFNDTEFIPALDSATAINFK
jgi:phosphoribosylglycinamide formyltransferase-1